MKRADNIKLRIEIFARALVASFLLLIVLEPIIGFGLTAYARELLPISEKATGVFRDGGVMVPPDKGGLAILKDLILGGAVYVKVIVAVLGVMFISILGLRLVLAKGNEEEFTTSKRGLIFAIIAFGIISMSEDVARIFDMERATLLQSPQEILNRVRLFDIQVQVLMTFIKYTIGAFATVMVIRSSISLITAGGDEEQTTKHKKGIMYSGGGLALMYVGDIFVNRVFYTLDRRVYTGITAANPGVDPIEGVRQIAGITNLVVSFTVPLALLMLIIGAILYVTSGGQEDQMAKAKRLILVTIAGMILIYGAFAIVSTVIGSNLNQLGLVQT